MTNQLPERAHGNHLPPDPPVRRALPPLSRAETAHLVRLAVAAAAEHGLQATYDGTDALRLTPAVRRAPSTDPPGSFELGCGGEIVAGLTNLARMVAAERSHRWPQLVAEHFDRLGDHLLHGPPPPPADPSRDLLARLTPTSSLPPSWTAGLREFLPGLLAVPATTDNGLVTMHLDPSDFGMTRAEALSTGLANLRRLPDTVEYVDHDGARIAVLSGSSFAASRALVLDTVLRETLHVENPQYGVLVALPVRSLLLIHVVTDLSVLPAIAVMLGLSLRTHAEHPGPLTPWIHHVTGSTWSPATTQPDDLEAIHLTPEVQALARTLSHLE
ncbi:hypothetical protein Kfla_0940 [Kribbella flavida DSM 17836]|uniref:Uncharacterized protein n=1 Tax=Kribbella flavida (strain DSM 17836 / JCM 10339 / NBRC 14399) TaxID=479435 RepID=D2Q047_KRIFD|nr:hypothetical protein [Kribbella flavida]ADB30045.1 hypothetical protein Kfla_0940 [Kribbella flavida DSM 17836]